MRTLPLMLLLCLSCADEEDRPIQGGNTGNNDNSKAIDAGQRIDGGNRSDGGGVDAQAAGISGRLCLVGDLRKPQTCAPGLGLAGVSVEVAGSGAATVSADDGSFQLPAPEQGRVWLRVSHGDSEYRDSVSLVDLRDDSAGGLSVPLVKTATWEALLSSIGDNEPDGTGSLAVYVSDASGAVAGAEVLPPSGTSAAPRYDSDGGAEGWQSGGATGAQGAALLIGVPAVDDTTSFEVSLSSQLQTVSEVFVEPGVLTFVPVTLN